MHARLEKNSSKTLRLTGIGAQGGCRPARSAKPRLFYVPRKVHVFAAGARSNEQRLLSALALGTRSYEIALAVGIRPLKWGRAPMSTSSLQGPSSHSKGGLKGAGPRTKEACKLSSLCPFERVPKAGGCAETLKRHRDEEDLIIPQTACASLCTSHGHRSSSSQATVNWTLGVRHRFRSHE